MLHVSVARSFSDVSAIRYVFPVLWTASCLPIIDVKGDANGAYNESDSPARGQHQGRCLRLSRHVLPVPPSGESV